MPIKKGRGSDAKSVNAIIWFLISLTFVTYSNRPLHLLSDTLSGVYKPPGHIKMVASLIEPVRDWPDSLTLWDIRI